MTAARKNASVKTSPLGSVSRATGLARKGGAATDSPAGTGIMSTIGGVVSDVAGAVANVSAKAIEGVRHTFAPEAGPSRRKTTKKSSVGPKAGAPSKSKKVSSPKKGRVTKKATGRLPEASPRCRRAQ